ncbi:MAG: ribonuclease H-like YkuK family protein [bacterium]|nr:ribonuclease H-like YkuK family protein [bacterium]
MKSEEAPIFHSSFGVKMDVPAVVREIVRFMEEGPKHRYKVIIGTDSEMLADHRADFVTAVVVHRVGNGGRYFWRRLDFGKFYTLRDRIIQEVVASLDAAKMILAELKSSSASNWDFEIHADIGANGDTKVLIQEVVGMIRANDFEVKTKPDSYAASKVADRYV